MTQLSKRIYASPSGGGDGSSPASPATLDVAVEDAKRSVRSCETKLQLLPGEYSIMDLRDAGDENHTLIVEGLPDVRFIVQAQTGVGVRDARNIILRNLHFRQNDLDSDQTTEPREWYNAMVIQDSQNISVVDCTFQDLIALTRSALTIYQSNGVFVRSCRFDRIVGLDSRTDRGLHCVYVQGKDRESRHIEFVDCHFQDCYSGFQLKIRGLVKYVSIMRSSFTFTGFPSAPSVLPLGLIAIDVDFNGGVKFLRSFGNTFQNLVRERWVTAHRLNMGSDF